MSACFSVKTPCFRAFSSVLVLLCAAQVGCGKSSTTPAQVTATPTDDDAADETNGAGGPNGVKKCDGCGALLTADLGAATCNIDGDLPGPSGLKLVPTFTGVGISQPIHLTHPHDGTDRIAVASRPGELFLFDNKDGVTAKTKVLDIRSQVNAAGEGGLLSVAYHPKYKTTRKVYVSYTAGGPFRSVISEFTAGANDVLDPKSERVMLVQKQPYSNHDGGHILFDKAGFLLIGFGDGGAANDPLNAGQDPKTWLGKILRIDVDNKGTNTEYAIPKSNPFVGHAQHLPETFAWGLRNPWRMAVDPQTGRIWAGDVGQNKYEEIDIIVPGGNYGWRKMEAKHCFNPSSNCNSGDLIEPVVEIAQKEGFSTIARSITGGEVYRGSKQAGLVGAYIFADYATGKYWTTREVEKDGKTAFETTEVLDTSTKPVSFGVDRDGEVYMVQLGGSSTIFRVVEDAKSTANPAPSTLSQTKCFASLKPLQAGKGLVPYNVNAPLWSDGAAKARWLVFPNGTKADKTKSPIKVGDDDLRGWDVPVGTIAIKHFHVGKGVGASGHVPMETRFIQRRSDGWRMLTYKWRADGSDADLWLPGGEQTFATAEGPVTWRYPSQQDCASCHAAEEPTKFLGLESAQLNGPVGFGGHNQLDVWRDAGLVGGFDPAKKHRVFGDPAATTGTIDERARTYLHVQCSSCHRPNSSASTEMDLRANVSFKGTGVCDTVPLKGDLGVLGAKILAPGDASRSVLLLRMTTKDLGEFMPSRGVTVPHQVGVDLVEKWIGGITGCD